MRLGGLGPDPGTAAGRVAAIPTQKVYAKITFLCGMILVVLAAPTA